MSSPLEPSVLRISLEPFSALLDTEPASSRVIGPVDFGWQAWRRHGPAVMTFGAGMLANSPLGGSRRLVFCGYSPQWESFYISSMGGAAYTFRHLGVDYVELSGRASRPSVLLLNHDGTAPKARLAPCEDFEQLWRGYRAADGRELLGIFALQQALIDRHGGEYPPKQVRAFVVGPAAARTIEGAIVSNPVEKGVVSGVTDWCGRGGLGSQMFRQHNLVGCVFGGQWEPAVKESLKDYDPYFVEHFGERAIKVEKAATVKYSLDPKTGTGGTFGSNYHAMGEKLMSFNYRSVFEPKAERLRQQQAFIVDHYLKQFNEETIAKKQFEHCGEPCSVACKKMNGHYKKDYEPYHTLGPQLGVFDQRAAELLNDHADAMGFDAIQIGGTLAWIMECVATGRIQPEDYGLPPKHQLRFEKFTADPQDFDLVEDSMKNARYAMATIDAILNDPRAAVFRHGIRAAARTLDQRHPDTRPGQYAVYLAHGENGSMVPNQYFVPGMGSPMPIMGKYYVYYGPELLAPDELGRRNVERMVYELISDNTGLCRFHRQWGEPMAGKLAWERFGLDIDYFRHHFELAWQIHASEDGKSVPWETERMAEMFFHYLRWQVESGKSLAQLAPCLEAAGDIGLSLEQITAAATLPADHAALKKVAHVFWEAIRAGQRAAFSSPPRVEMKFAPPAVQATPNRDP
ncbi:aldehyde ferredoxin oxidoreductase N-terminal domain-containing protein [Sulfuricystis thermophila]|uniref:aldehyde ferredoxin oxidoreductase N-terminal domain-containing protein n=1 Tax=Sulfuricystis thermophila TaxID=2496847 RepID=UPI001035AF93|nr:aldehyde ferredoxin oxidoreductase N-terminal domain-containing protein [Sulfuricystis thermophila]